VHAGVNVVSDEADGLDGLTTGVGENPILVALPG
jgi:hypothetical protein